MAYCSLANLIELIGENALIQLTDDAGAGVVDQAKVTAAIDRADAKINGYLASVASLPLARVPPMVAQASAKLAVVELYLRREVALTEPWQEEYKTLIQWLNNLAQGRVRLPELAAEAKLSPAPARAAAPPVAAYPNLTGFG